MNSAFAKSVEWVGSALQIAGALLVALNLPISGLAFPVMLTGSCIWLIVSYLERRWSLLWMQATFAGINILGILRWLT
jgi:hypothetical protein